MSDSLGEQEGASMLSAAHDRRSGKGCWYMTYTAECPVCGRGEMTRERRYGPPPEDRQDRFEHYSTYDHCEGY